MHITCRWGAPRAMEWSESSVMLHPRSASSFKSQCTSSILLQYVAVYCSVLQCVEVCCSVLQRVRVCSGALQRRCVATTMRVCTFRKRLIYNQSFKTVNLAARCLIQQSEFGSALNHFTQWIWQSNDSFYTVNLVAHWSFYTVNLVAHWLILHSEFGSTLTCFTQLILQHADIFYTVNLVARWLVLQNGITHWPIQRQRQLCICCTKWIW